MRSSVTSNVLLAGLVTGLALRLRLFIRSEAATAIPSARRRAAAAARALKASAGAQASRAPKARRATPPPRALRVPPRAHRARRGGGGVSTAGATGTDAAAGAGAGGGTTGTAGASTGGAGTSGSFGDITKVMPSMGCGMTPPAVANGSKQTIQTMGTKPANCADSNCAPWSYARDYYVTLPANYDGQDQGLSVGLPRTWLWR